MLGKKDGQIKNYMLFLIILTLSAIFVYSIGTNDVRINSPDNATWTNTSRLNESYSPVFNISWANPVDPSIQFADCTLYINTSANNLVVSENQYNTSNIGNNTDTVLNMNRTLQDPSSLKVFFWTVECANSSATPTSWFPTARVFYLDNDTIPSAINSSMNFINNSWTNSDIMIEALVKDDGPLRGDSLTVERLNGTGNKVLATASTTNFTMSEPTGVTANIVNVTSTLIGGTHYYLITALDILGGETLNATSSNISTLLNVTGTLRNATNLTWDAVPGAVSYRVYNASSTGNFQTYASVFDTNFTHSGQSMTTGTPPNITTAGIALNLTNTSLPDGIYSDLKLRAIDPANNKNISIFWNISLDQTEPDFIGFDSPTPTDKNNITSGTNVIFKFTVDEINLKSIILEFGGTDQKANQTLDIFKTDFMSAPSGLLINNTNITETNLTTDANYSYMVTAIDRAGDETVNSTHINYTVNTVEKANATNLTWTLIDGAVKYRVYNVTNLRVLDGISSANFSSFFEVTTNIFIHTGQSVDGEDTIPSVTLAHADLTVCNTTVPFTGPIVCNVSNSSLADKQNYSFKVYIDDYAGNVIQSTLRTFSLDTATPIINNMTNWTMTNSIASFEFNINDTTPASCKATFFDRDSNYLSNVSGTLGTQDTSLNVFNTSCTGTFNFSNINSLDGAFSVIFNVTDGVNRSIESSKAGVMTRLYTGWNLITYPDGNKSIIEICDEIEFCNKMSWFNNTAGGKSFLTFSNSTPSVNNGTNIASGEAVFVSVTQNSWIITNDWLPLGHTNLTDVYNFSLSVPGWNAVGLLTNTSLNTTLYVLPTNGTLELIGAPTTNITYTSWLNASAETYYSCKRTLNKCSGTSMFPVNIDLKKGYAVWMLPKNNITINRSSMTG